MHTTPYRSSLIAARPHATGYADAISAMPLLSGMRGRIDSLTVYPIKALEGVQLQAVRIGADGLYTPDGRYGDRAAMLAMPSKAGDGSYVRFSQRDEPALACIRAGLTARGLAYAAAGMDHLHVGEAELQPRSKADVEVECAGDRLEASLERGPMTRWIRTFLAHHASKKHYDPESVCVLLPVRGSPRFVAPSLTGGVEYAETAFSDGGQVLVASADTLDWMNASLGSADTGRVSMRAFRPNITVRGLPPNAEDVIGSVTFDGGPVLKFGGLCVRCAVTTLHPETGQRRTDGQPLKWLAANRPPRSDKPGSATFAVNAAFDRGSSGMTLRRDDSFTVGDERH